MPVGGFSPARNASRVARSVLLLFALLLVPAAQAAGEVSLPERVAAVERDVRAFPERALSELDAIRASAGTSASPELRHWLEGLQLEAWGTLGRAEDALRRADALEQEGRASGDQANLTLAFLTRYGEARVGALDAAATFAEEGYAKSRTVDEPYIRYLAAVALAATETLRQDAEEARGHLHEALVLANAAESAPRRINVLLRLAFLDLRSDPQQALVGAQSAFAQAEAVGSVHGMAEAQRLAALAHEALAQPVEQLAAAASAVQIARDAKADRLELRALAALSQIVHQRNDYRGLLHHGLRRLELAEGHGDLRAIAASKEDIALALHRLGKSADGARYGEQAKNLTEAILARAMREDYLLEKGEQQLELARRDLELKAATVRNLTLQQRLWWAVGLCLALALAFSVAYYRKQQALARVTADNAVHLEQLRAAKAEEKAETAAVEPHFLFNTLANLQALVRTDPPAAETLVADIVCFYQGSMKLTRAERSTLEDEFALMRSYLRICRTRFGDRLSVQLKLPDALKSTEFPPMVVATLVENAMKHGVARKAGPVDVVLEATGDSKRFSVTVADTGAGFNPKHGTQVGLQHVRKRLEAIYKGRARLELGPNEPCGFRATIVVEAASA